MLLRKNELKAQAQKMKFKIQKEEDDEDNQAESDLTSQLSTLTKEFTQIKQLVERIFNLMGAFVIKFDNKSLNFISKYENLEEFFADTLIKSENSQLRAECGKRMREILTNCSNDEDLRETIVKIIKSLLK